MSKIRILNKIIRKYSIKHGDLIDINTLKYISAKENIEINYLIIILGISVSNRYRIWQNAFNKARVKIFDSEELKEIEIKVKDEIKGTEKVSQKHLDRLCSKYRINQNILAKMLNLNSQQLYKLKNGQKYIILKRQTEENQIINELFLEDVKYRDFVTNELINLLKPKYKLDDEKVCFLLKVNPINYKNLMTAKTKKMKIDLIDEYEKREIEQKLVNKFKSQHYITKKEILQIKNEIKTTNQIIRDVLSISSSVFCELMKGNILQTRIILKDTKLKVNYLLLDIKYIYGEKFYTNTELRRLCRMYKIEFDDFLKNLSTNIARYPYIKQALKQNENGIYIGEDHRLSQKFLENYANRISNICKAVTNKYCYSSFLYTEKSDISQEAFIMVLEKGGCIEKNFSFNEDLMFNLFACKIKYFVIGKANKRYKEILIDNFEEHIGSYDEYEALDNDTSMFTNCLDSRIKLLHQYVMHIFQNNKDYIHYNRKKAYKIIAYKLKISIEKLEKTIQEIRDIYLEYGFARECANGNVIDMSNLDIF